MTHLGIDYGSKMAGTTAISYLRDNKIKVRQSVKNKDADAFILSTVEEIKPEKIFLDAPLSLPAAFYNKGDNYFYRACDKKLKAMSPMFLGGLTARAMRLASILTKQDIQVIECYPKALVHIDTKLLPLYQKKNLSTLPEFCKILKSKIDYPISELLNWHQVDAVIAWWSGNRYQKNTAEIIGDEEEGQIIF